MLPIVFQGFDKRETKAITPFFFRSFLTIHAGVLFYPANPPISTLLDKRRGRLVHVFILHSLLWNQHRNDVTAVFSIDAKILVQGEDPTLGVLFRHPNQTGIGQGHGDIGIALDQIDE